tara:strand:- start:714 stop:959 length:246 start_codon:yes stop_codon:yes gene_type:complete
MGFGRLLTKLTKRPKVKKALKKLKEKNTAKTTNTKILKAKPFKVASKSKSKIIIGRGVKVATSGGLLSQKKTIKDKKLLGV